MIFQQDKYNFIADGLIPLSKYWYVVDLYRGLTGLNQCLYLKLRWKIRFTYLADEKFRRLTFCLSGIRRVGGFFVSGLMKY